MFFQKDTATSTSRGKRKDLSELTDTGNQLAQSMSKLVELAANEQCAHTGFLAHLKSIMDDMPKRNLI